MKKLVFFVFIIVLSGCSKDDDFDEDLLFQITDSNYPTFYQKLSGNEIEEFQNNFEEGSITFSQIDSFGFVGWSYDDDFEVRKNLYEKQFSDASALLKMIKLFLVEKSEFTGVTDTSLISSAEVDLLFLDFGGIYTRQDSTKYNHIGVNFGSQTVDGLEIYNSLLTASATANGVHRIFGHWYPDVYIPATDKVSLDLAKSVLTGRELTSYDGWGNKLSHIIVAEDFEDYRKIIYPYINEDRLELRVCYNFTLSHWQLFMDTTTGEILVEQDVAFYLL